MMNLSAFQGFILGFMGGLVIVVVYDWVRVHREEYLKNELVKLIRTKLELERVLKNFKQYYNHSSSIFQSVSHEFSYLLASKDPANIRSLLEIDRERVSDVLNRYSSIGTFWKEPNRVEEM
jgi:hypothetical protein